MQKFKSYITNLEGTQASLANAFGISQGYLNLLLSGKRTPSLELALRIEEITQGAVPVKSWAKGDPVNGHAG